MNPTTKAAVVEALKIAVLQNEHDMLMTGDELRQCEAAHKYMPLLVGEITDLRRERDELASRVRELEGMNSRQTVEVAEKRELRDSLFERLDAQRKRIGEMHGALSQISEMTFDPWTNGAIAKQIADAALNASKEQP